MSEDLHRKLAEKLRQEDDYPGFSNEGWLSLESRLERFDRRRRLGLWLLFGLPLAALFGLNLYLLLGPTGPVNSTSPAPIEKHTTYLYDTIVNKITVYEYDTIYRKIYREVYTSSIPSLQDARRAGASPQSGGRLSGNLNLEVGSTGTGNSSSATGSASGADREQADGAASNPDDVTLWQRWDSAFAVPYLSLLPFDISKKQILSTTTSGQHKLIQRMPFLRRMETGITAGIILTQKNGTNANPGFSIALENEMALGQDNWTFWQSIGWQQLKLQGREKEVIPGFPSPPSPVPDSYLELVDYTGRYLTAQLGLNYNFRSIKSIQPIAGFGIGGIYRLKGEQYASYENEDHGHYGLSDFFSKGWGGFSSQIRAGFGWQFQRLLQIRLQASYSHMLTQTLNKGNIGQWWGLNVTLLYRWR